MALCDICNAPGMGTIVSSSNFKKAVQNGFNPYKTGLAPDIMASIGMNDGYEVWKNSALSGKASFSDWNICPNCMKVLKSYLDNTNTSKSLEKAREKAKSQVPSGQSILSEEILSDGKPKTAKGFADTIEEAYFKVQKKIPEEATIIKRKEITKPRLKVLITEAYDETMAKDQVLNQSEKHTIIKDIKLVALGKKGFLGIGKKPNKYEVEVFNQAIVEITYKVKAKITDNTYKTVSPDEARAKAVGLGILDPLDSAGVAAALYLESRPESTIVLHGVITCVCNKSLPFDRDITPGFFAVRPGVTCPACGTSITIMEKISRNTVVVTATIERVRQQYQSSNISIILSNITSVSLPNTESTVGNTWNNVIDKQDHRQIIQVSDHKSNPKEVKIGKQIWMAENLNVSHFRNGDPIPHAETDEEWARAGKNTQPAWCYYDNDPKNGKKYGKLYNWYAVNDRRGLAPEGWKIPSDAEWTQLTDYLGGEDVAGGTMKEKGTKHWKSPNTGATNKSGFSGLPGGFRYFNGYFGSIGYYGGYWWSSIEYSTSYAWGRYLLYYSGTVYRFDLNKENGLSVRCLRD